MMSGIRNAPPISTSSPRETITSLRGASDESISSTAAALLLTTVAASAPVSSHSSPSTRSSRSPRPPLAMSYSRLAGAVIARSTASIAASGSSARPRLVCSTVPVQLKTGRSLGRSSAAIAAATARAMAGSVVCAASAAADGAPGPAPAASAVFAAAAAAVPAVPAGSGVPAAAPRSCARSVCSRARTAAVTRVAPCAASSGASSALPSTLSTAGRRAAFGGGLGARASSAVWLPVSGCARRGMRGGSSVSARAASRLCLVMPARQASARRRHDRRPSAPRRPGFPPSRE